MEIGVVELLSLFLCVFEGEVSDIDRETVFVAANLTELRSLHG